MVSEKGEEEDKPVIHEEIRATLQSLKEKIDELEWRIQNPIIGEYLVKGEGGGECGGPSLPPSPSSSLSSVSFEVSKN